MTITVPCPILVSLCLPSFAPGPIMSSFWGKVQIQGITEIQGEKVFVLCFLQARNPDWSNHPFFARFDPEATWLDQLKPAFGESQFFYEK